MRKKLSFVVIVFSLSFSFVNALKAQNCAQSFIEDVLNTSRVKNEKFYKKVKIAVKNYSKNDDFNLEDVRVLNIPIVFSTKEGTKISSAGNLSKEKLLCYLDGESMIFDEALVIQDTVVLGAIIQNPDPATDLEFIKDVDLYRVQLAKAIIKTNPDIVFNIYNIPRCYWYVKGNELFVLSYEHKTNEMKDFIMYKAKLFIEEHLKDEELCFLSHKRVIVISGK